MQQEQLLPSHTLTLKELYARPNMIIFSEQGMRLRTEIREHIRSTSPIPKKNNNNRTLRMDKSQEITYRQMKTRNSSFYQARQQDTLIHKNHIMIKIKKQFDQRLMEKLDSKFKRFDTPNQTIQNRIQNHQEVNLTIIESKLDKLHENYQIELKKREWTQQHIQEVLRQQKLYSQRQNELYDSTFERPYHKEIEQSYYKDPKYQQRKQIRLLDYQKNKYEKYWKLQPILGKLQN